MPVAESIKRAIARLRIRGSDGDDWIGTGFLVAPGLILTALHVVADRQSAKLRLRGDKIEVKFNFHSPSTIELVVAAWDCDLDIALLEWSDCPPSILPVPLRDARSLPGQISWATHGFVAADSSTQENGKVQKGEIRDLDARLGQTPALQLFCEEAAAGKGEPISGLSGAPCVVGGYAVGVIRRAWLDENREVVGGTLYATPIASIVSRCSPRLQISRPMPFEENIFEDLAQTPPACSRLRQVAEHLSLTLPSDVDEPELRRRVAIEMIRQGPAAAAAALQGLVHHLPGQTPRWIVSMIGAAWVDEHAASTLRDVINATRQADAVALNARRVGTSEMYVIRAVGRCWGWDLVPVVAESAEVDAFEAELRGELQRLFTCEAGELDHELRCRARDNKRIFVIVHHPAHQADLVTQLRHRFPHAGIHFFWLSGDSFRADLRDSLANIVILEPELRPGQEEVAVNALERARRILASHYTAYRH